MFSLLKLFRKTNDEALNDNDYDFNEIQSPGVDVQGEVESQKPALIDNAFGAQQKDTVQPISTLARATHMLAEQAEIDTVRDELDDIGTQSQSLPANSQDRKAPFDVSDIDHRRVKRYKPEYVGKGGENVVYALPDHPNIVVKAEVEPLKRQIEVAEKEGRPVTNKITDQQREELNEQLAAENTNYNELRTYFGDDHVPQTSKSMLKVPVSKDTLEAVYGTGGPPMPNFTLAANEMWTIVAIQEKVPQIADDKSLDVRGGFAERRHPADEEGYKQAYETATQDLVRNPDSTSFDLDQFLVIHPDLRTTLEKADTNPQLKNSLKDFVQKAMDYSKQTGKGLDLAGAKNILFFENPDNSWNYKLVDALSPYAEESFKRTKDIMGKVIRHEPLDGDEQFLLTSAVNYQRTVNGLAKHLGIDEHLDMIPYASAISSAELWDLLDENKTQETSLNIPNDTQPALGARADETEVAEFIRSHREDVDYSQIWGDAQALFIGEIHDVLAHKDEVIRNLPDFQRQGLTHVAMEMFREEHQPTLDAYFAGTADRNAVLELLEGWDKGPGVKEKYMEMVDAVKTAGLGLLAVDLYTAGSNFFSTNFLRNRNYNWARIIKQTIDRTPNARVLVYDGKHHSNYNILQDSANETLANMGVSSVVIALTGGEKQTKKPWDLEENVTLASEQIGVGQDRFALRLDRNIPTRPADYLVHLPQS